MNAMQNMCRTCMRRFSNTRKKIGRKKQSILEIPTGCQTGPSIMELLQLVQPQIKVEVNDNLPTLMCLDCIQKLLVSYEFIELYKYVDTKFRKILKENVSNCDNDSQLEESLKIIQTKELKEQFLDEEPDFLEINKYEFNIQQMDDEDLDIIEEKDPKEEVLDKEDDIFEINKYEINIEQINVVEEEEEQINEWPEYDDEPLNEYSEESEGREPYFFNPYSDASDSEWTPEQSCQTNFPKRNVIQKRSSDSKIDDDSTNSFSAKLPKKKNATKRKDNNEELSFHAESENGKFPCQQCKSVFDNVELWQEHMRQHRLDKMPRRKYTKKSDKQRQIKSARKVFECEYCGKEFAKIQYLKTHLRVHTGEQPYLCIECGKSFKNVSSLNTHMLRHKGEKTFQCQHCPKKFVCSSGLYGHMMVHTKEKPFVCDICGSAFHMAYQLRKHNLYHNGIKNYPCEYCDMRFVTREKQRRHMRTHTGEKPYRCKFCERAFAQSNDCVKHLRQHLGDNVYQCELCPLRFPLARDLRAHFAHHKDDDEETRSRNLKARMEEERKLQIKFGSKTCV